MSRILLPQDSVYKCPHCKKWTKKVTKQDYGRSHRDSGLWQCEECGRQEAAMMWMEVEEYMKIKNPLLDKIDYET